MLVGLLYTSSLKRRSGSKHILNSLWGWPWGHILLHATGGEHVFLKMNSVFPVVHGLLISYLVLLSSSLITKLWFTREGGETDSCFASLWNSMRESAQWSGTPKPGLKLVLLRNHMHCVVTVAFQFSIERFPFNCSKYIRFIELWSS